MTEAAPLILTPEVCRRLHRLRNRAARQPIDMGAVAPSLQTAQGRRAHVARMDQLSLRIDGPWPFFVTFSIEIAHPVGPCRHMSMSVMRPGHVPHPHALEMLMQEMGFEGGLAACNAWPEGLRDGRTAINVIQPLAVTAGTSAAPAA